MSHRPRFRTMIVAIVGGVIVALGSNAIAIVPAAAEATTAEGYPNYLFAGPGVTEQLEKAPDKTEKLGGSVTSKIIDLGASILKCVLNITSPSVKCNL